MSNQDKHIIPWSASDVQKYLKGELSAREMHQLEKAALEDPFLADAIEGLSQRPATPLAGDLDDLQARLDARVSKKNKRPMAWIKMAAVIVLLLGLGFTAWYLLVDTPTARLAKSTPVPTGAIHPLTDVASAPSTARASSPTTPPQTNAVPAETSPGNAATPALASARKPKNTPSPEPAAKAASIQPNSDSITLSNTRIASLDIAPASVSRHITDSIEIHKQLSGAIVEQNLFEKKVEARSAPQYRSFGSGWQNENVVYNGQVLDRNNRPLAGASLLIAGSSNAIATTNALGQFKLNLRPQDTTRQLTVALPGYQNASLAVNKMNFDAAIGNTIILREQPNAFSEVLVNRTDHKNKEYLATAPSEDRNEKLDSFWIKVAPVTGRLAYLEYLSTAKRTLPVDTTLHGAEVVSFGIDPKGVPIDFKIEHSLSPAHDAGVIRLILEGARWKILRGKNVRAMVDVSFP